MKRGEAFWVYVDDSEPLGCWTWLLSDDGNGYGQYWFEGRRRKAHQVAFFLANGYWPLVVRHTCDNPMCCNPLHLLGGTVADNNRDTVSRGRHHNQKKTHCISGHPLFGENLYLPPDGGRSCKECTRLAGQRYRLRLKERT